MNKKHTNSLRARQVAALPPADCIVHQRERLLKYNIIAKKLFSMDLESAGLSDM
jgi:hypothetical protein